MEKSRVQTRVFAPPALGKTKIAETETTIS
jgi:hypothetical protein